MSGRDHISRSVRFAALIAVAVVLASCDAPAPAPPTAPLEPRSLEPAAMTGAVTERGEGIIRGRGTQFFDCLGEAIRFRTDLPYRYRSATTPEGKTTFVWTFIPNAHTGTATGVVSGTAWTLERAISPEVDHFWPDGSADLHWTANFVWRSSTGQVMHLHSNVIASISPEGEFTFDRLDARCTLQ